MSFSPSIAIIKIPAAAFAAGHPVKRMALIISVRRILTMAKKVLLLCGDFTEDYETMVPFQALGVLGYQVDAVCPDKKAGETVTFTNTTGKTVTGRMTSSGKVKVGNTLYSDFYDADPVSENVQIKAGTAQSVIGKTFLKNFAAAAKLGKTGFNKDGKGTEIFLCRRQRTSAPRLMFRMPMVI